jgi:hypothetical protein
MCDLPDGEYDIKVLRKRKFPRKDVYLCKCMILDPPQYRGKIISVTEKIEDNNGGKKNV